MQHISLATLVIPGFLYREDTEAELAFLDLSSLSPRLPNQRTRMCGITRPGMDPQRTVSSCQMQREYRMLQAPSLTGNWNVAIQNCYSC